jgi:GAF domain-containing protein
MNTPSFFLSGTEFSNSVSQYRHIALSNFIALVLFGLAIFLEIMYLNFYGPTTTAVAILIVGCSTLFTVALNRWGFTQASRAWLCITPPSMLIAVSIYAKFNNSLQVREYDYFTYRIVLLALAVLPVVMFTNRELRIMMVCLIVSGLLLFLFDPIHLLFGAENKAGAFPGSRYYFVNVVVLVAYVIIIGSVLFLKSSAERKEILREQVIENTETTKQNLLRYQNAILTLAKDFRAMIGTEAELSKRLCEVLADNLRVSRVSVWNLSEQNTILTRVHLHEDDMSTDEHVALKRSDFPAYFQALETEPFIMATDAQTHADTSEFTESYLKPLQIISMLDCPIVVENRVVGVICCENKYETRDWKPEDTLFMQSLSDLIAEYRQNEEIRKLYLTVQQKNNELVNKTNEIKSVNDNLEWLVRNRTQELEERNQKLVEYGFINSHLLRAPLTRILGLSDLISREVTLQEKQMLLHLLDSARELDKVISRINDTLNENQFITKEDVISGSDKPA